MEMKGPRGQGAKDSSERINLIKIFPTLEP
jgi:hypothetical protein